MIEKWKDIEGYGGKYQISNLGNIRSWSVKMKGKIMKPFPNEKGYMMIALFHNGRKRTKKIARLVAKYFVPNPDSKPEVNHIDADKENNKASNLEWCTRTENIRHAFRNNLIDRKGESSSTSKLTDEDVLDIRNAFNLGCFYQQEIAEAYGVTQPTIGYIVRGDTWTHI